MRGRFHSVRSRLESVALAATEGGWEPCATIQLPSIRVRSSHYQALFFSVSGFIQLLNITALHRIIN